MNNTVRLGSFVLACALGGAAFAQGAASPAGSPAQGAGASSEFGSLDTNRDGKVSSTEAQSNSELRSAFSSLDADKDTYLSQSEFAKWNKTGKSGSMPGATGSGAAGSDRSGGASSNSSNSSDHTGASPQSAPQSTDSEK